MGNYSEMHIAIQDEIMNLSHQASEGELSNLDALIEMRQHREEFEKGLALIKDFENNKINEIAFEAEQYPKGYRGFEIKKVNGRKTYNFKSVPAWIEAEENKKAVEDKYRLMFEAKVKGVTGADLDPETGEILPLPEVNYGASYITVKQKKSN